MKIRSLLFGLACLVLAMYSATAAPQSGMSAQQAVDVAKSGVDPSIQGKVVSVYGTGTTAGIDTWWVIFYDPSVDTHGRAVRVANGQVVRSYPAAGGVVYADSLTFPASDVRGINRALSAAEDYASAHSIPYNQVRALLRLRTAAEPLQWRMQLMDNGANRGFVFVNASTGEFASFSTAGHHHHAASTGGDSVSEHAQAAGNDIKDTFLGIGGDLQQFFTGERTVDQ